MKHNYLKHLFTVLLLLCSTVATAHDFEVDGIYYNILSEENKTVEITYKGTSYSQYTNEYTLSVIIPSKVSTISALKTTIIENFDAWTSTNKSDDSTSQTSYTLNVEAGNVLKFDWSVSSESNYDWLVITLDGTEIVKKSGTLSGSYEKTFDTAGSHTLVVKYTKDSEDKRNNDEGKIYNVTLNGFIGGEEVEYSVISIGEQAFRGCFGLTYVEIPNSVTSIENEAFMECTRLTNIVIPNSVASIGNSAFYYCTELTSVVIGNCVKTIGEKAFCECFGLTSITIPNSVTSIGNLAFYRCTNLTGELIIPNSVTSIGNNAFSNCTSLTGELVIPNSVTSIGSGAFYCCSGLTSVEISNSVTYIGSSAFGSCTGLTSVEFPNSVTYIGGSVLSGCSNLTSVVIPNSVTRLNSVFYGCSSLTSITSLIPADKLFTIDSTVFPHTDMSTCTLYVPFGAKETYASTEGWSEFVNIVELEPSELTITINEYGCATYCSPYALDFSEVEGLKAYNAIGYKPSTQTVTLARVMTSGAGQGIFIKGEPGEYAVSVIDNFDEYTLNLFVGTLEQTTVNSTAGEMSNYKFTVAELDEAPMFYPFEDNTTFSAGKAYLQIPTAWLPTTAQKSINIRFDEGETTGVEELKGENGEMKTIYDLSGRVVENPTSGIYIIDGKKVIIK